MFEIATGETEQGMQQGNFQNEKVGNVRQHRRLRPQY